MLYYIITYYDNISRDLGGPSACEASGTVRTCRENLYYMGSLLGWLRLGWLKIP